MRHGSLFSGIGGFDLAASWMGWENVFQCERDRFCKRILRYYWPSAKFFEDVREFKAAEFRGTVDIISGGFPCQPFSVAGKRRGTKDERHLWPEMCRIIGEVRPAWVVGENVYGFLNWGKGMVFEQVQADLEAEGYEVWTYVLPACGIGAVHRRTRVWLVAHANRVPGGQTTEGWKKYFEERQKDRIDAVANGKGKLAAGSAGRYEWRDPWADFPTEPPVCAGDDGVSAGLDGITFSDWRIASLRGAGNAIVPQVALQIFKAIERVERLLNNCYE